MNRPLRIGVSACFFHPDGARNIFKGKTLLYYEESMVRWLMSAGAMPVLVPRPTETLSTMDLVSELDGVLLHGGDDVSPETYGQTPRRDAWRGDRERDVYDIELIRACLDTGKPILGICRGVQILNVALGGDLLQDIVEDRPGALVHRDWHAYDRLQHDLEIEAGSYLEGVFEVRRSRVNSVHHQAIDRLGDGLAVEARSPVDGIIEAVRLEGAPFVVGIQWHPEFQGSTDGGLLPAAPLLERFIEASAARLAAASRG